MTLIIGPFTKGTPSTDGLIFFADSSNPNSFDSTNSIWKDLTTNAQDADASSISYADPDAIFDGASSIASFFTNSKMADVFQSKATVSVWVNITSDGELSTGRIAGKGGWYLYVENELAGSVDISFVDVYSTTNGYWRNSIGDELAINTWTNITVSFVGSPVGSKPVFYINGVAIAAPIEVTSPVGGHVTDANSLFVIGNNDLNAVTFDGIINIVKVWDNILTPEQVLAEYNSLKEKFQ